MGAFNCSVVCIPGGICHTHNYIHVLRMEQSRLYHYNSYFAVTPLGFVAASATMAPYQSALCSALVVHLVKAAFSGQVSSLEDLKEFLDNCYTSLEWSRMEGSRRA